MERRFMKTTVYDIADTFATEIARNQKKSLNRKLIKELEYELSFRKNGFAKMVYKIISKFLNTS